MVPPHPYRGRAASDHAAQPAAQLGLGDVARGHPGIHGRRLARPRRSHDDRGLQPGLRRGSDGGGVGHVRVRRGDRLAVPLSARWDTAGPLASIKKSDPVRIPGLNCGVSAGPNPPQTSPRGRARSTSNVRLRTGRGCATSRVSTPRCNWWWLFAVRLGSGVGRCRRDVADALLDERRRLAEWGHSPPRRFLQIPT